MMAAAVWKQRLGATLLAVFVGTACSNPGKSPGDPSSVPAEVASGSTTLASFHAEAAGFERFESEAVRRAAMDYPAIASSAPESPISLTADDGTGLVLEALDVQAVIEGPLAFSELHMRFRNPQSRTLEGRFQITLPEGASVSRLAMRMSDGWREAEVVELQAARRAYEDFLHRKQDPMLLEKEAGNQFRARIFPIPADGVKEVILSFSQELRADQGYTLPLRGLPAIADLHVRAQVAEPGLSGLRYQSHEQSAKGTVPSKDFHVALHPGLSALRDGQHIVARVRPKLAVETTKLAGLTLLFDTSASRAPGFARQVRRLGTLIASLAEAQGRALPLKVAAFDQEVAPIYSGAAGDFGEAELRALLSRRPLGASNLDAALVWAGQQAGSDRLLIVGDAVATAGEQDLAASVDALPASITRVDVLLVGGIQDAATAGQLARGHRALDGVVLQEDLGDAELARRLGSATTTLHLAAAGASWLWPQTVAGVQPGDEILVYAGFAAGRAPTSLSLTLEGAEPIAPIAATTAPGPLLERAAMQSRIAALQSQFLAATDADKADIKARIVDLSTRHRVLSDHTALLVLETEADYARFQIDRRALADILTVQKAGLALVQRTGLVIAKEPDAALARRSDPAKKKAKAKDEEFKGSEDGTASYEDQPDDDALSGREQAGGEPGAVGGTAPASSSPSPEPPPPSQRIAAASRERQADMPARRPAPAESDERRSDSDVAVASAEMEAADPAPQDKPVGPPALTGKMADIHTQIESGDVEGALANALRWRSEDAGNVMALIALGGSLEAAEEWALAARAYGSIIDLFPSRADLRRFASARLTGLERAGLALSIDSLERAAEQRPDHLSVHRLLAYAKVRAGDYEGAFAAIEAGLSRNYPEGRFAGGERILREDMGIIAAAWLARAPAMNKQIASRLKRAGATMSRKASTRFVLNWETDANDVDFHIYDGKGGHAFFSDKSLASGGELFADVTTGYGPECFAIAGTPQAFPYNLQIHYYSRGPMGYGMGQVEVLQHDGKGGIKMQTRPFVVMNDGAYLDLGSIEAPL